MKEVPQWRIPPSFARETACCFTGHRPEGLPAGEALDALRGRISLAVEQAVRDGYRDFISGMARGVDSYGALAVLRLKQEGWPVRLIAVLPCLDQAARWREADRRLYRQLLAQADEVFALCERYEPYCMGARNLWMVEHASRVIAVYGGSPGGTANTLRMARERRLEIWHVPLEEGSAVWEIGRAGRSHDGKSFGVFAKGEEEENR